MTLRVVSAYLTFGAEITEFLKFWVCLLLSIASSSHTLYCSALYESDVPETEDEYEDEDADEETYATVTSFFVPTRHIDYTGKSQLKDIVNAPFAQETEKDQACLAYLARRLHNDGGGLVVDTTGFTFRWVKDYHPNYSVVVCPLSVPSF